MGRMSVATLAPLAHPPPGVLAPRPRCCTRIDANGARAKELLLPVDLLELEHGPRAAALGLRALDERASLVPD